MAQWKIASLVFVSSLVHSGEAWGSTPPISRYHAARKSVALQQRNRRIRLEPESFVRRRQAMSFAVAVEDIAESNNHQHHESGVSVTSMDERLEESLEPTPQEQIAAASIFPDFIMEMDRDELISKSLNALFLLVCFGFAFSAIVDVNHGITRGWSQQEIALRIPLDTWSSYEVALEEKPITTKTMINVIIYLLGDWLSQTVFANRNVLDFDLGRTLRNGLIGLGFGPLVHEYYQFSDHVLPVEGGFGNRILKIFMDQTIYLSVKCSIYIMAVNTLQGEDFKTSTTAVKDKLPGIVTTAWKFWPLIHCITYSVIPARHRILWVNCVDLVWNAILASMSQKTGEEEEEDASFIKSSEDELPPVDLEIVKALQHHETIDEETRMAIESTTSTIDENTRLAIESLDDEASLTMIQNETNMTATTP